MIVWLLVKQTWPSLNVVQSKSQFSKSRSKNIKSTFDLKPPPHDADDDDDVTVWR